MSNKKKPKKLRSPNVPSQSAVMASVSGAAPVRSGRPETGGSGRAMRAAPAAAAPVTFDYTYVKQDLRRIAILAASFVVVLIVLSFIIK